MLDLTTNRILQHLQDKNTLAIISPYRTENSNQENKRLLNNFKSQVRSKNLGFSELKSKWVEIDQNTNQSISSDERALMIYHISLQDAMNFGRIYNQSSIIYKDANRCAEVCTTSFIDSNGHHYTPGNIVRTFNVNGTNPLNLNIAKEIFADRLGGPASKPIKSNRAFTLKEVCMVESPRGNIFSNEERYSDLLEFEN